MLQGKKIACVIPARLKSTRFPKKMLSIIQGKPMLQWIWDKARGMKEFDEVIIAVDSKEVADLAASFHARVVMTSEACPSGTDRLIEVMNSHHVDADIWVNWQGDEPLVTEQMISVLLHTAHLNEGDIWTLKTRMKVCDAENPHFVKVVCDAKDKALYFSRSPIPFYRDVCPMSERIYFKHVGLYAYTKEALQAIAHMRPCLLEEAEKLEQLRFLDQGLKIYVHEIDSEVQGVDTPQHLAIVAARLN